MNWTIPNIVTLISLVLLLVTLIVVLPFCATVNVNNKIEYAEENGYTFYLNGKDITDSVEQCDPMSYDVSLEKWDEHVVLLFTR